MTSIFDEIWDNILLFNDHFRIKNSSIYFIINSFFKLLLRSNLHSIGLFGVVLEFQRAHNSFRANREAADSFWSTHDGISSELMSFSDALRGYQGIQCCVKVTLVINVVISENKSSL